MLASAGKESAPQPSRCPRARSAAHSSSVRPGTTTMAASGRQPRRLVLICSVGIHIENERLAFGVHIDPVARVSESVAIRHMNVLACADWRSPGEQIAQTSYRRRARVIASPESHSESSYELPDERMSESRSPLATMAIVEVQNRLVPGRNATKSHCLQHRDRLVPLSAGGCFVCHERDNHAAGICVRSATSPNSSRMPATAA